MATPLETAIDTLTSDPLVRAAMRLGALLEGGSYSGPWASGDNGQSHGPYQIYTVAHPEVSQAQASDPAYAVTYMYAAYQAAADQVRAQHGADWVASNPMAAAAMTVYYAERPKEMYPGARIAAAWATVTGGGGATAPAPGGETVGQGGAYPPTVNVGPVSVSGSGLPDPAQIVRDQIAAATAPLRDALTRPHLLRAAAVLLGALLLIAGLVVFVQGAGMRAGLAAVQGAA